MKTEVVSSTLIKMANHRHLRKLLAGKIDNYIYKNIINNDSEDLKEVQIKRYQFLSAMLRCVIRNIDKGWVSSKVIKKIINVLVQNNFIQEKQSSLQAVENFQKKYGEPFMYKSQDKTLLDIFEKYNDMLFLIYTNGTAITNRIAAKLKKTANATPAISVEGYEKETDARRGRGVYKKILKTFERLRNAGVPFGISVTATSRNADLLLTDEFYDFYFKQQGACYMWQFQLMPIGRGKDELGLMVTPQKRVQLFRKWEKLLAKDNYCLADFWNSGVLSRGCIAYGRSGGYFYIDWNGNITPCAFIPYYVDNIYDLYSKGKTLSDALFSDFMKNGREWQREYGLAHLKNPNNWLMPCSIRDHYEIFKNAVLSKNAKPEDEKAKEALESDEYFRALKHYDEELESLTGKIWQTEYLSV